MAFEVTATRRRPQQFESLAGQEFVVSTLKNAIDQGRIAHAYLFSGPRGVGKTTCARLLAKALNCQNGPTSSPCGECENCTGIAKGNNLDVIEIDGASNTGVNDVRVIKEEVMFPPTSSRYKIYIIDEVHMLSQSAFNALLKTIEEPPEYVVFIFATTETQKVPATIRSRCQQFNFHLIGLETIKKLLKEASDEMGIEAEDDALFWIAKEATGSMRDAYTLFDQIVSFSNGKITLAQIREKLGLVGNERINEIMEFLIENRLSDASSSIQELLSRGMSIDQIIKDFTDYFRSMLLIKEGVKSESILGEQVSSFPKKILDAYSLEQTETALEMFLKLYRDIRYSLNPRFELELAVSKLARLRYLASNSTVMEKLAKLKEDLFSGKVTVNPVAVKEKQPEQETEPEPEAVSVPQQAVPQPIQKPEPVVVAESKPEPEFEPEPEPAVQKAEEYTLENLSSVLPQGVGSIQDTENGLVLQFGSRFFYQMALKDLDNIRSRVQTVTGPDKNIVISFSEKLEQERHNQIQSQYAQEHKPEPAVQKPVEAKPIKVEEDENKFFVDDLINAFRGKEEK